MGNYELKIFGHRRKSFSNLASQGFSIAAVLQKHAFSDRLIGSFTIQISDIAMNRFEKGDSSEEQDLLLRALKVLFI